MAGFPVLSTFIFLLMFSMKSKGFSNGKQKSHLKRPSKKDQRPGVRHPLFEGLQPLTNQ